MTSYTRADIKVFRFGAAWKVEFRDRPYLSGYEYSVSTQYNSRPSVAYHILLRFAENSNGTILFLRFRTLDQRIITLKSLG